MKFGKSFIFYNINKEIKQYNGSDYRFAYEFDIILKKMNI